MKRWVLPKVPICILTVMKLDKFAQLYQVLCKLYWLCTLYTRPKKKETPHIKHTMFIEFFFFHQSLANDLSQFK